VVVGCSVGVHVLNHGLQLGGGAVLLSAAVTAFQSSDTDAGTWHVGTGNAGTLDVGTGNAGTWYVETRNSGTLSVEAGKAGTRRLQTGNAGDRL